MRKELGPWLAALLLAGGCKDIDRFTTEPDESYCGKIVSVSIVRLGFSSSVCMRMTFDARHVSDAPGALWTDDGVFHATPLRPIPQVLHDPLLTLNFGEGREKNLLFAVEPEGALRGASAMAVVSLLHSGSAELRLLRGAETSATLPPDAGPTGEGPPLFGVFTPLEKKKGQCRTEPGCNFTPE